ncbi:MAG: SRPBCC domain-containing protein [Actinobacteria bacterium]|nr:SRPBCC domain-containing protein [Actinomycetota bacterium]
MRDPFTTSVTTATTTAPPRAVWHALTRGTANLGVPRGLVLTSSWRPGDPVELHASIGGPWAAASCSHGEVLAAVAPARLTYTLGAGSGGADPAVIVTWEVAPEADGSSVRLTIDDLAPCGSDCDVRDPWRAVAASLVQALDLRSRTEDTPTEH